MTHFFQQWLIPLKRLPGALLLLLITSSAVQAVPFELHLFIRDANLQIREKVVTEEDLRPYLKTIEVTDPIFSKDGPQQFSGMPFEDLPQVLQLEQPFEGDLTMLANDGYSTHEPFTDLVRAGALLAFEQNGEPISPRRGGPVKVMSTSERDVGLYTWYVKMLLFGHIDLVSSVEVQQGDATQAWSREQMLRASRSTLNRVLPIPRGVRKGVMVPNENTEIGVVPLSQLLPETAQGRPLRLRSSLGLEMVIPAESDRDQLLVAYSLEGNSIPETFGGGFIVLPAQTGSNESLLFPNKLEAFFHLESIQVQ